MQTREVRAVPDADQLGATEVTEDRLTEEMEAASRAGRTSSHLPVAREAAAGAWVCELMIS